MGELAPGTRIKTYRTDRDSLEEYWDILGVIVRKDDPNEYESYIVTWSNGRYECSMMRDEFDILTEDEERLAVVVEIILS